MLEISPKMVNEKKKELGYVTELYQENFEKIVSAMNRKDDKAHDKHLIVEKLLNKRSADLRAELCIGGGLGAKAKTKPKYISKKKRKK